MSDKIVLISDDSDFFDYIRTKLALRKSDELFCFSFDNVPEKLHLLSTAVLIVNSETSREKTSDLLSIFKDTPIIVSAFNDDEDFKQKCYREGAFDFITLMTSDAEFQARLIPALSVASLLNKNRQYREYLVEKGILTSDNEVFLDYDNIIDKQLEELRQSSRKAVFIAISPNEKTKFILKPTLVEAVILNNIRKDDILMSYATNKYFLIMFDIELNNAIKVWAKILSQLPEKIYAGFANITNQKRQQLINEALNKLHQAINSDKDVVKEKTQDGSVLQPLVSSNYRNFKMFRQEFAKKIDMVITPVFYQIQQKYSGKLLGVTLQQGTGEGYGVFYIKGKNSSSSFRITCPGFSVINIDITFQKDTENIDAKRITLDPEELEAGLLEDLLEQFVIEYKNKEG